MPEARVAKAFALSNAKISFVSLVNKAANKKQFLITKADDGTAKFTTYGRILKADQDKHYVTGIVYEPMVEDTQGEFMTEDEIIKAEAYFMKNSGNVDIQHNFEKCDGCNVVESFVTKSDSNIEGQSVKKGTWVMTVEVTNPEVWNAIQKGDITGFSMGGVAQHSTIDETLPQDTVIKNEKKVGPLMKGLADLFGYKVVRKEGHDDSYTEEYMEHVKSSNFYTAMDTLEQMLRRYNPMEDKCEFEKDETRIRSVLTEFSDVITNLLMEDSVTKALEKAAESAPVQKAGKKLSTVNHKTLKGIYESLGSFLKQFEEADPDNNKEETEMEKAEVQKMIDESITKSLDPIMKKIDGVQKADGSSEKAPAGTPAATTPNTATETAKAEGVTEDQVNTMIGEAVEKAVTPISEKLDAIMKARGIATNLNGANGEVKKSDEEECYLHGIL